MSNTVERRWKAVVKLLKKCLPIVGNRLVLHTHQNALLVYTQQLRFLYTPHLHSILVLLTTVNTWVVHTFHRAYKYNYSYIQYN
jgi:hypothetical protein